MSLSQLLNHQIENCELYEIKLSILKTTNNEIIKSCFFWIIYENDFQIFNANWYESSKMICENHDHNDFSNHKMIFDAKITITVIFQIYEYNSWIQHIDERAISTMTRIKWYCYFKKFRCLEKNACKKFKIQNLQKVRIESRQTDSKHQFTRRSISSY